MKNDLKRIYIILFIFFIFSISVMGFIFYQISLYIKADEKFHLKIATNFAKKEAKDRVKSVITLLNSIENKKLKEKIAFNFIKNFNKTHKVEYIFVYKYLNSDKYLGVMLINPNRKDLIGKKVLLNKEDIKNNLYRMEMKKAVLENKGRFVKYYYKMPNNVISKKITYIEYYKPLNLLIASGVYIKTINQEIKKVFLSKIVKSFIISIILIIILYLFIIFGILTYVKNLINHIETYNQNLKKIINIFKNLIKKESIFEDTYLIEEINKILSHPISLACLIKKEDKCIKINDKLCFVYKKLNKDDLNYLKLIIEFIKNRIEIEEKMLNLEKIIQKEVEKNRQKDKQLLRQSRLAIMGETLSMIAHQWRQPLSAISNYANNIILDILMNNLNKEELEKNANKILELTQHLSNIINNFSQFFKENLKEIKTNSNKIIEILSPIVLPTLKSKNINFIIKNEHKKDFLCYQNYLIECLLNLISNSKDAILEKKIKNPFIKLQFYKKDDKIFIEIEDNAGGIPEKYKDKIFEPYFSTKSENGSGLGLYMCKQIIEKKCKGKLYFENTNDGIKFIIELKDKN